MAGSRFKSVSSTGALERALEAATDQFCQCNYRRSDHVGGIGACVSDNGCMGFVPSASQSPSAARAAIDPGALTAHVALMRGLGIVSLSFAGLTITLGPEPTPASAPEAVPSPGLALPDVDPVRCACGHDDAHHNDTGECLMDCAVEVCARKREATP